MDLELKGSLDAFEKSLSARLAALITPCIEQAENRLLTVFFNWTVRERALEANLTPMIVSLQRIGDGLTSIEDRISALENAPTM